MGARRNTALTIAFAAIDPANRPARKSGISWSSDDVQVSKDGSSFVNSTNTPTAIGSTGRYSLTLTAAEMNAAWVLVKITNASMDDTDVMIATSGHPAGTVVSNGGNTATTFKTDRTEATNDHWKDALLTFTSGALAGQVKKVSAYDGTTKFVTISTAYTAAPSSGDAFLLIEI